MIFRIYKVIATSGFMTALECTNFVFGRGSAPDPTEGAYGPPPDPIAGLRGPASREIEQKGREEGKRKGTGAPLFANSRMLP